jgi:hypothetical protein
MFNPHTTIPEGHPENENLMYVISEDEVLAAIRQSSTKKSPGADGLSWEFYLKVWGIMHREVTFIMNEIQTGNFDKSQKENSENSIKGYRPIFFLNYDYKWFLRIIKTRLEKLLPLIVSD